MWMSSSSPFTPGIPNGHLVEFTCNTRLLTEEDEGEAYAFLSTPPRLSSPTGCATEK